nr:alanyl-tRNA editing protein Aarsd1 [Onthophagus taurus]
MVFKCQEDSFLKEFTTTVIDCTKAKFSTVINGKKEKIDGFEIVCEDTILFPEGGGQPSDHGFLNNIQVYQVNRRGDKAVHYTKNELSIGEPVKQIVDWKRRLDHMQQHSGQHLLTAIIDREFKFSTVSWWLGEEISHVELDTSSISKEQIEKAEYLCNELIRDAKPVNVELLKLNENTDVNQIRARGLPKDHVGDVRIITIENVESNMCCGTHVSNLAQLQVIKLLNVEKSSRKNNVLLNFLVGNRVLEKLGSCLEREQKLITILNNAPSQHFDLVEKLVKTTKILNKNQQSLLKDIAAYEVEKLKGLDQLPKYFMVHRKEGDFDFMNQFIKLINSTDIFLVLSIGEEKGNGNIVLYGKENVIADLGNKICQILSGKGAGKGNKYQGKVNNLGNLHLVEDLLKSYFK